MQESEKWKWSSSVVSDSSDPMDCSLPGSSVHGIFQARVLEWGATAFSYTLTKTSDGVSAKTVKTAHLGACDFVLNLNLPIASILFSQNYIKSLSSLSKWWLSPSINHFLALVREISKKVEHLAAPNGLIFLVAGCGIVMKFWSKGSRKVIYNFQEGSSKGGGFPLSFTPLFPERSG